jgi:hypothetical protein
VKRLAFAFLFGLASLTVACGGGGNGTPPPPPTGGFTNASLKGNYAFSMSGQDGTSGAFITRIGSFIADGNGNITNAIEDLNDGGAISTVSFSQGGTYSIQANGKGTLTLQTAAGTGLQLSIALAAAAPAGKGFMIQTDLSSTSSGNFNQQNVSFFTQPFSASTYVFDFSGIDSTGFPITYVGNIALNGSGSVGTGTLDRNDGGNPNDPSGPLTINAGGSYQPDNTAGNAANFGRGTITFGGLSFAFYPIDQTHTFMLETDGSSFTSGDAFQQNGTIATQTSGFSGNFAFLAGGTGLTNAGAFTLAARFNAAGGNLTSIRLDQNNNGSIFCVDTTGCGSPQATGTYTIGPTPGRGTLMIQIQGQQEVINEVFYMISPTSLLIQDNGANVVANGSMLAQSGTLSNAALAGNYIFNFTGQVLPSTGNVGFEEDFVGQYALSSSTSTGNITGVSDFVELGSTSNRNPAFLNIAITGTLQVNGDGTLRNGYQIVTGNSPSTTINFTAYIVSPSQVFLIGTGTNQVIVGNATSQVTP